MSLKRNFIIRDLTRHDFNELDKKFGISSEYRKPINLWEDYLYKHSSKERIVKVVEVDQEVIGICTLKFISDYPYFIANNIPEINDLLIYYQHRNQGYGKALITAFEIAAKDLGYQKIGLAVGLYNSYGPAQRLYVKMGYIPDGAGITYFNQAVIPGESYRVDDDLLLWLVKLL